MMMMTNIKRKPLFILPLPLWLLVILSTSLYNVFSLTFSRLLVLTSVFGSGGYELNVPTILS